MAVEKPMTPSDVDVADAESVDDMYEDDSHLMKEDPIPTPDPAASSVQSELKEIK